MQGTIMDATSGQTSDQTFVSIVARAARYPVMVKSSQLRIIRKGAARDPPARDPGIQWLLSNTLATSRLLKGTA